MASTARATRLAPTPSGALHLGNARTFLVNWAMARRAGWRIVLRLEDLDHERVRPGAHAATIAELAAIGLDWDGAPEIQSADLAHYRAALSALAAKGLVFACTRSRREIRLAASAPHQDDGETRYDPSLRPPEPWPRAIASWPENHRLRLDPAPEMVVDGWSGRHEFDPGLECGDLVVWTRLDVPAYQLAVVVDDARQGVTDVVRGDDLLASAARQQVIARHLGLPHADWWHLPLLDGTDGKRLAKRNGAHGLGELLAAGATKERIAGWCAWSLGLLGEARPVAPAALVELVEPSALARGVLRERAARRVVTDADLAWIRGERATIPDPGAPASNASTSAPGASVDGA